MTHLPGKVCSFFLGISLTKQAHLFQLNENKFTPWSGGGESESPLITVRLLDYVRPLTSLLKISGFFPERAYFHQRQSMTESTVQEGVVKNSENTQRGKCVQ